ncbi:hypothetical protein EDC01DRAFT_626100 [Geopyxis carbonaria]|nr:hypothetical protein EDC01DRAFT_626100 [Geopyxis carbonaria]
MTVYFAYGSNMHLPQMAHRCPQSTFLGHAVLTGYKIQINDRGYANIVADESETVEGLCYILSAADEVSLDGYEGVEHLCYSKSEMQIQLFEAPERLRHRRVAVLVEAAELAELVEGAELDNCTVEIEPGDSEGLIRSVTSLVYASVLHVSNGVASDLYKHTVSRGVQDASRLGVSASYLNEKLGPLIQFTGKAKTHWMLRKTRKVYGQNLYRDHGW